MGVLSRSEVCGVSIYAYMKMQYQAGQSLRKQTQLAFFKSNSYICLISFSTSRWTIVSFFKNFLQNQIGNKCDPKQTNPKDWRCMIGGFDSPRPSVELQLKAFDSLVTSRYKLSHVELPLKLIQAFVPSIYFITVLRHPIERVISSYGMMKEKACFANCTLQSWLQRKCYLNPKVQLGRIAQSTFGVLSDASGSFTTGELDIDYMTRWLSGMTTRK